jgi:transcriptional regulator with XRE-family HTH domain
MAASDPGNFQMKADTEKQRLERQRRVLRHFLRSRRARLSPLDVGLTSAGRRHTPGLRREEVAVLAGVSASWYTWLEQGRDIKVSDGVLDAISGALRLNEIEREHLYRLAGTNPPPHTAKATVAELSRLQRIVGELLPAPAYVVDRYWNTLATNKLARSILGVEDKDYNYLLAFFADPSAKERYPRWDEEAGRLVGQLRVQAARFPEDASFDRMAGQLSATNTKFAELWARHEIRDSATTSIEIRRPGAGILLFEQMTLGLAESPDLRLMLYSPSPTSSTAAPVTGGPDSRFKQLVSRV